MELVITTVIVIILAAIAVPNMSEFLKNERLTTQINILVASLQYARSEALLRQQQVVVCASDDTATCGSSDWADGWLIFFDADEDGSVSDGDELLKAQQALEGDSLLNSSGGSTVIFDYRGFAPNSNSTFTLCDDRGADYGKSFSISVTGRVNKVESPASCS